MNRGIFTMSIYEIFGVIVFILAGIWKLMSFSAAIQKERSENINRHEVLKRETDALFRIIDIEQKRLEAEQKRLDILIVQVKDEMKWQKTEIQILIETVRIENRQDHDKIFDLLRDSNNK